MNKENDHETGREDNESREFDIETLLGGIAREYVRNSESETSRNPKLDFAELNLKDTDRSRLLSLIGNELERNNKWDTARFYHEAGDTDALIAYGRKKTEMPHPGDFLEGIELLKEQWKGEDNELDVRIIHSHKTRLEGHLYRRFDNYDGEKYREMMTQMVPVVGKKRVTETLVDALNHYLDDESIPRVVDLRTAKQIAEITGVSETSEFRAAYENVLFAEDKIDEINADTFDNISGQDLWAIRERYVNEGKSGLAFKMAKLMNEGITKTEARTMIRYVTENPEIGIGDVVMLLSDDPELVVRLGDAYLSEDYGHAHTRAMIAYGVVRAQDKLLGVIEKIGLDEYKESLDHNTLKSHSPGAFFSCIDALEIYAQRKLEAGDKEEALKAYEIAGNDEMVRSLTPAPVEKGHADILETLGISASAEAWQYVDSIGGMDAVRKLLKR